MELNCHSLVIRRYFSFALNNVALFSIQAYIFHVFDLGANYSM